MFSIYLSMRKSFQHQKSCSVLRVILKIASCIMLRVGIIEMQCFQLLWRHQPLKLEQVLFYNVSNCCGTTAILQWHCRPCQSIFFIRGTKKRIILVFFPESVTVTEQTSLKFKFFETIWPKIFMQQQWQHRQALMRPSRAISQQIMKCP